MPEAVIASLIRRRADLAGEMRVLQTRLNQVHADLASLDDVIRKRCGSSARYFAGPFRGMMDQDG